MSEGNSPLILDLIKGHKDFRDKYYRSNSNLFKELAKNEEAPKYLMIACADSQVDPTLITNCAPTDIYLLKNLGSFIPPFDEEEATDLSTVASIEFALNKFGIEHIILLGHRHCKSVKALVEDDHDLVDNPNLEEWLSHYQGAKDEIAASHMNLSVDEQCDICEKLCLLISLKNLSSYPWVQSRLANGELSIHTWYFDVDNAMLQFFNQETTEFEQLEECLNEEDTVVAYREEIMGDVDMDAGQQASES